MLAQAGLGAFLGGLFGFAGALVAPRWMAKRPPAWEQYATAGVTALLTGLLAYSNGLNAYFWQQLPFFGILITAALVDLHDHIIPNELVLFGLVLGLVLVTALPYPAKDWVQALLGGAIGFGSLFLLALLVKGGLGYGDVKLGAVIGLFLGLNSIFTGLLLAFIAGGLVGVLLLLFKIVGRKDMIPFGPYLALGAVLTVLYGEQLALWWRP